MRKIFCLFAALFFALNLMAQDFRTSGRKAVQLAPKDWTVEESRGDLNKDGIADLLILATPHDESKAGFNDNFEWVDSNRPVLAVYWGSSSGIYRLYKTFPQYFDGHEGDSRIAYSAKITPRGTIRLQTAVKNTDGSNTVVEIFRWQNGGFFKIGHSEEVYSRSSGVTVLDSYNYSIRRLQHLEYRGDPDSDPGKQEQWTDLPDNPLERL